MLMRCLLQEMLEGLEAEGKCHVYSIEESAKISKQFNEGLRKLDPEIRRRQAKSREEIKKIYVTC